MGQQIEDPPVRHSVAEYFEIEYASDQRYEFREGEVLQMAGGTESHGLIKTNLIAALVSRLASGPCRVYDSDLRLRVKRRVRYTYSDIFVVCGERIFDEDDPRHITITNPRL